MNPNLLLFLTEFLCFSFYMFCAYWLHGKLASAILAGLGGIFIGSELSLTIFNWFLGWDIADIRFAIASSVMISALAVFCFYLERRESKRWWTFHVVIASVGGGIALVITVDFLHRMSGAASAMFRPWN